MRECLPNVIHNVVLPVFKQKDPIWVLSLKSFHAFIKALVQILRAACSILNLKV